MEDLTAAWLDRLQEEHSNLRAALAWARRVGDLDTELRLAAALARFWGVRGHLREGERRLAVTLAHDTDLQPPARRAAALAGDSVLALRGGDYGRMRRVNPEALELFERAGDRAGMARALDGLGTATANLGDLEGSLALYERSRAIFRDLGDERGLALSAANIGCLALMTGDYERASELSHEAVERQTRLGQLHLVHQPLFNVGLADVLLGRHDAAMERLRDGIDASLDLRSPEALVYIFEGIAAVDVAQGRPERAARLLGASAAAAEAIGASLEPLEQELHDRTVAAATAALGAAGFVAARDEGARLGLDDAVALAVDREARVGVDLA